MNWEYCQDTATWLYGEPDNGAGVYNDGDGYEINIVIDNVITNYSPYSTLEEAKEIAEIKLAQLIVGRTAF